MSVSLFMNTTALFPISHETQARQVPCYQIRKANTRALRRGHGNISPFRAEAERDWLVPLKLGGPSPPQL